MRNASFRSIRRKAARARLVRGWLAVVFALFIGLVPTLSAALERHGELHPPGVAQQLDNDGTALADTHLDRCPGHQGACHGVGLGILPRGIDEPETVQSVPAYSLAGPGRGRVGGRLDRPPRAHLPV